MAETLAYLPTQNVFYQQDKIIQEEPELISNHNKAQYLDTNQIEEINDEEYDSEKDSDYIPSEEDTDSYIDSEEEDPIDIELDENVDELNDIYLKRMLETRMSGESETADEEFDPWVENYIRASQEWKDKYGESIDEIDLDLRLAGLNQHTVNTKNSQWRRAIQSYLPRKMQKQSSWQLLLTFMFILSIFFAVSIQVYTITW